jgi:GNAT superfamily N-acetyltransferase
VSEEGRASEEGRDLGEVVGALPRALEFQRATLSLMAERVEPIDQGWLVRDSSLPLVWDANHVRITRPVTFAEALELAQAHLGDLPRRQLVIEDESTGWTLERRFAEDGWKVERQVVMQLLGRLDREAGDGVVIEPGEEPVLGLTRRWIGEGDNNEATPAGIDQVVEFARRVARARDARLLGVAGESGGLAAITTLCSDGAVAQLDAVYTVPEERNRGHARALVTRAAYIGRKGGHDPVFIVADDNDWPKQLYARIGFISIGWTWTIHRSG